MDLDDEVDASAAAAINCFDAAKPARGRPTEIGYLNGEVVRLGEELGVPTPLNALLVELVHQVEHSGRFWKPEALCAAIDGPD